MASVVVVGEELLGQARVDVGQSEVVVQRSAYVVAPVRVVTPVHRVEAVGDGPVHGDWGGAAGVPVALLEAVIVGHHLTPQVSLGGPLVAQEERDLVEGDPKVTSPENTSVTLIPRTRVLFPSLSHPSSTPSSIWWTRRLTASKVTRNSWDRNPKGLPSRNRVNKLGTGKGVHTTSSGIEGAWKPNPTRWDNGYFETLFRYEWVLTKSPAGAHQWTPKNCRPEDLIPDAHDPSKKNPPMMTTADLSLRMDPAYEKISRRYLSDPKAFADAFALAWFKLTHRDMGPRTRYLGPLVPKEELIWQDPIPAVNHKLIDEADSAALKKKLLGCGLSIAQLVRTAWASASTFSGSDKRGGANGARIRLAPQRDWAVNEPTELKAVLAKLEAVQEEFNAAQTGGKKVSLADLIVLGGVAAVEAAADKAGVGMKVPFTPGRKDASQEQTDAASFAVLEPAADGFRNCVRPGLEGAVAEMLLDKAQLLTLTAPK